ncbi:hypothetical protein BC834DRAFT_324129 [Gloeopeniophorella convolvens]|nr:hypothetical protein BC834DRAFT_324129 [Gloeopeniophorella convolvens]
MEPVADPPAPLHGRPELKPAERIELELEVLSTSDPAPSPIAAELHTDVAAHAEGPEANDAGTPPPLGIKLTGYRLLNIIVLIAVGLAKFILSLKGHSATPTGLEWMAGSILAAILYWLGFGVMRARALYWEVHPFYLPVGTPVPVRTRAPSHPVAFSTRNTSITLLSRSLSWSLCAILILIFTKVSTLTPNRTRI